MKKQNRLNPFTVIVFVFSIFWLMPLIFIFINSFKPYNDMMQNFLALPAEWSLDKYIETWTMFDFPRLLNNTFFYTGITVLAIVLFAPMAAYKLARTKSRLSVICFGLIIMPMMVPFQSYMISLSKVVANFKLMGTHTGYIIVSIGLCMPLAVFMIHGFVKNIPL